MLLFQANRSFKELSTFGIGGAIRWYVAVRTIDECKEALAWARKENIRYFFLGKGSNCLFSDQAFDGLVIHNKIDFCEWGEFSLYVGAGYSFSLLGHQTAQRKWGGLEFASGIPGSVGGAVYMNAGANKRDVSQVLAGVLFLEESGHEVYLDAKDLHFSYRRSPFQEMKGAILAARFHCTLSSEAAVVQRELLAYRIQTQPYRHKNAGCIFKNPSPTLSAGALIDRCGLKGLRRGGAEVSDLHANFIINRGEATAAEVRELMEEVRSRVYEQEKVWLETEVLYHS